MNEKEFDEIEDIFDEEIPEVYNEDVVEEQQNEQVIEYPEAVTEPVETVYPEAVTEPVETVYPEAVIESAKVSTQYNEFGEHPSGKIVLNSSKEEQEELDSNDLVPIKLTDNKSLMFVFMIGLIIFIVIMLLPKFAY